MFFSPTDFHRFSQIWLHVIRVHLCHQWEMFFSPTDFTDLHGLGYCYPCSFVSSVGNVLFSHGFSQIFTDLVTCYPCSFVASVGIFFLPRISQIFTDLVTCYPCSFVASVGNVLFSHGFSQICTDLIINYPWVLCLWVK